MTTVSLHNINTWCNKVLPKCISATYQQEFHDCLSDQTMCYPQTAPVPASLILPGVSQGTVFQSVIHHAPVRLAFGTIYENT